MYRGAVCIALLLVACETKGRASDAVPIFATPWSSEQAPSNGESVFAALPQRIALDPSKVALGRRLFRDRRLSVDGRVACVDCHVFLHGGASPAPYSKLPGRAPGGVNVPSLFNAAFNFRFGWSGRFEDIGQQLDSAMQAPAAMASSWQGAAELLARDRREREAFAAIYHDGLTAGSLREVLALYSLSLVTPNSRFDRFLRGELALAAEEQRGYELFRDYGCVSCHHGINVGGNMLQRFGVMQDYFAARGDLRPADLGLFAQTHREEDRHVFRVPSLRNVALTPPYFHDASAASLEQAVTIMARYQLGRELQAEQAAQIAAFLRTLTGELPSEAP